MRVRVDVGVSGGGVNEGKIVDGMGKGRPVVWYQEWR